MESGNGGGSSGKLRANKDWDEKLRGIRNEVLVTLMEDPPNGMKADSLKAAIDFLDDLAGAICADLYDQYKPFPRYVLPETILLLTDIRAYRIAGKAVPHAWIDLGQDFLKPIDEQRPTRFSSKMYLKLYEQRQCIPVSSQAILQTFVHAEISGKYGTSNTTSEAPANTKTEASATSTSEASGSLKRRRSRSPA